MELSGRRNCDAAWTKEDEAKWDEVVGMLACDMEASWDCRNVDRRVEMMFWQILLLRHKFVLSGGSERCTTHEVAEGIERASELHVIP